MFKYQTSSVKLVQDFAQHFSSELETLCENDLLKKLEEWWGSSVPQTPRFCCVYILNHVFTQYHRFNLRRFKLCYMT